MSVATEVWGRHASDTGGSDHPTIVFTTEAKSMMEEQQVWVRDKNSSAHSPYEFQFMTNGRDIMPDSGFIKDVGKFAMPRSLSQ